MALLLQAFIFPLFATTLSRSQGIRHIREAQSAISLGLSAPIEVLLFLQLLKPGSEVNGGKVLSYHFVLPRSRGQFVTGTWVRAA
jgi:hypothetical protein